MKKIIFAVLFLSYFISNEGICGKFKFDIVFNSSIGYRLLSGNDKSYFNKYHKIGYLQSFGFNVNRNLSDKIIIGSGFYYNTFGFNAKINSSNEQGFINVDYKEKLRVKFLSIPIALVTQLNDKHYFKIGLFNNFLFRQVSKAQMTQPIFKESKTVYTFKDLKENEYSRFYQPSIFISYGFVKKINEKLSVALEPTFNFMLLDSNKKLIDVYYIKVNCYNFGLNLILRLN